MDVWDGGWLTRYEPLIIQREGFHEGHNISRQPSSRSRRLSVYGACVGSSPRIGTIVTGILLRCGLGDWDSISSAAGSSVLSPSKDRNDSPSSIAMGFLLTSEVLDSERLMSSEPGLGRSLAVVRRTSAATSSSVRCANSKVSPCVTVVVVIWTPREVCCCWDCRNDYGEVR